MKYYKAIGASTAGRIMSSKEIDQLAAQSLSKPNPSANTPVAPADKEKSKPIVKSVVKRVVEPSEPFAHLQAKPVKPTDSKKALKPFAHLAES
ncbi:hypothetical protein AB4Z45_32030 [Paenibacillus sp. MCAF9]|uniref:hypothetical protein n=1 Tax=Paenibacillus sp. MCAF9 TaxID=3233046 RepID=UPI003F978BF4